MNVLVHPADFILIDSWERLAAELGPPFRYTSTDDADTIFKSEDLVDGTILLTGCSDAEVCEQESNHPNGDLLKMVYSLDWLEIGARRDMYCSVQLNSTFRQDRCQLGDRYSLKADRTTFGTFHEVPGEVRHWFTTNLNVIHPRVTNLPFGLNTDGHGAAILPYFMGAPKKKLLYLNWRDNSLDRARLREAYRSQSWVTYKDSPDLPVADYFKEMAEHRFVLCPRGNGLDCYRTYEALYLGCIPILRDCVWSCSLLESGLPVAVLNRLDGLTPDFLEEVEASLQAETFNYEYIKLSHWRQVLLGQTLDSRS